MADLITQISSLKENDLRTKVVIPLLEGLNAMKVEDWHGSNEEGKDVYFCYLDPFGDKKHCCCFIKAGNITKSGKTDIRAMEGQLKEAIVTPCVDPFTLKSEIRIEETYIVLNGRVNKAAKEYIYSMICGFSIPSIRIIDIDKLVDIISNLIINPYSKLIGKKYIFDLGEFPNVCRDLHDSNR